MSKDKSYNKYWFSYKALNNQIDQDDSLSSLRLYLTSIYSSINNMKDIGFFPIFKQPENFEMQISQEREDRRNTEVSILGQKLRKGKFICVKTSIGDIDSYYQYNLDRFDCYLIATDDFIGLFIYSQVDKIIVGKYTLDFSEIDELEISHIFIKNGEKYKYSFQSSDSIVKKSEILSKTPIKSGKIVSKAYIINEAEDDKDRSEEKKIRISGKNAFSIEKEIEENLETKVNEIAKEYENAENIKRIMNGRDGYLKDLKYNLDNKEIRDKIKEQLHLIEKTELKIESILDENVLFRKDEVFNFLFGNYITFLEKKGKEKDSDSVFSYLKEQYSYYKGFDEGGLPFTTIDLLVLIEGMLSEVIGFEYELKCRKVNYKELPFTKSEAKKDLPLLYKGIKLYETECNAFNVVRQQLKKKGLVKKYLLKDDNTYKVNTDTLPKITVDDYERAISNNEKTIGYANNPFLTKYYTNELKEKIKEAKKKVKIIR